MTLCNRIIVLFLSAACVLMAQENQYVLLARPLALDLTPAPGGVPIKDLSFDYNNAVLQQNYVLDLIRATTGVFTRTTDTRRSAPTCEEFGLLLLLLVREGARAFSPAVSGSNSRFFEPLRQRGIGTRMVSKRRWSSGRGLHPRRHV